MSLISLLISLTLIFALIACADKSYVCDMDKAYIQKLSPDIRKLLMDNACIYEINVLRKDGSLKTINIDCNIEILMKLVRDEDVYYIDTPKRLKPL